MGKRLHFLWLGALARLPFPLLYGLSNLLAFTAYRVIGYRRAVVEDNLRHAFPEMTEEERRKLGRRFFQDLADLVLETVKLLTISRKTLLSRIRIEDTEGARALFAAKKPAMVMTAHYGNWEWAGHAIGLTTQKPVQVIYKKLRNENFNAVMKRIRERFGNEAVPMEHAFKRILEKKERGVITCFLADQTPQPAPGVHWTPFLGREAPFFMGPEKISKKVGAEIYFGKILKEGRGWYKVVIDIVSQDTGALPEGEITERYARLLEGAICEQPSTWLWSHRRWKHKRVFSEQ